MRKLIAVLLGVVLSVVLLAVTTTATAQPSGQSNEPRLHVSAETSSRMAVATNLSEYVLREIGVSALTAASGLSGAGVKVGIVDTGCDPATIGNICDFVDLTSEGEVRMSTPLTPDSSEMIHSNGISFLIKNVPSKSWTYRIGYWDLSSLSDKAPAKEMLSDIARIWVLVTDSEVDSQFDTVYVDTDDDKSFADETPLKIFSKSRKFVLLSLGVKSSPQFALLVGDIRDNGRSVILGFDAHGHGTALASILSGTLLDYSGVCPSAQILAVKAVDSSGGSSWGLIAQGISEAARRGAKIIIVSSAPDGGTVLGSDREVLLQTIKANPASLVVLAAGNAGPGIGTLSAYGRADNLLVVGGLIPSSVSEAMGWGDESHVWPWSSRGPDAEGHVPSLVAPALAPALMPAWMNPERRVLLFEGTSCSAAYTGGVAALLAEEMQKGSVPSNVVRLRISLESSASPLVGVLACEQGHGALNASAAIEMFEDSNNRTKTRVVMRWDDGFQVNAFFDRTRVPGQIPVILENFLPSSLDIQMNLPSWITMPYSRFSIAAVDQRETTLRFNRTGTGLFSDFVSGIDMDTLEAVFEFPVTQIVPRTLGKEELSIRASLGPSEVKREFIKVGHGQESMTVSLKVGSGTSNLRGRAALYIYDENGRLAFNSSWVGMTATETVTNAMFTLPGPGVWEIVVIGDPMQGGHSDGYVFYTLAIASSGLQSIGVMTPLTKTKNDSQFILSCFSLLNSGTRFQAEAALLVDGENGWLRSGEATVGRGHSVAIRLPQVARNTNILRVSLAPPVDSAASLTSYLYFLDEVSGRWQEIESGHSSSVDADEIVLLDPVPGTYVVYVEGSGIANDSISFRWLALTVEKDMRFRALNSATSSSTFSWPSGTEVTVEARAVVTEATKSYYLLVWDKAVRTVRACIPVEPIAGTSQPLITISKGSVGQSQTNLTFRAWDSGSMKPIDACVEVNGIWYQMYDGRVSLILPNESLANLRIRSEYPGMIPWTYSP